MWGAFLSFMWWSLVLPLFVLNILFLCCSSNKSIWRSPCWAAVTGPSVLDSDGGDSLDETEASSNSSNSSSSSSSRKGGLAAAEEEAVRQSIPDADLLPRKRRVSKGDTASSSSSSNSSSGGTWKRDRSLLARARTYLAIRIVSLTLPTMWLLNVFLLQQLLLRLLHLLQQKQQQHLGLTDALLWLYGLYAIACCLAAEQIGLLLRFPWTSVNPKP